MHALVPNLVSKKVRRKRNRRSVSIPEVSYFEIESEERCLQCSLDKAFDLLFDAVAREGVHNSFDIYAHLGIQYRHEVHD